MAKIKEMAKMRTEVEMISNHEDGER